jgi:hypothetical protein
MPLIQMGLFAAVVLLLVVWLVVRRRGAASPIEEERIDTVIGWPPKPTRILNTNERAAYDALTQALPEYIVLAQVPLSRFLTVSKRNSYADWLRRLGYQCVDFAVCDKASQVIAVVELQPAGGPRSERNRKRAKRMARTLEAAGIPLHVWIEDSLPTFEGILDAITPEEPASALPAFAPTEPSAIRPVVTTDLPVLSTRASKPNPFEDSRRDASMDETIEMLEPPSTWFDDIDSGHAPLRKH